MHRISKVYRRRLLLLLLISIYLIFHATIVDEDDTDKDGITSLSSASPLPAHEIYEHIVKSPPEPTRVKSPEQILMRSPDPVNWIVPLDTGKTFTVTQNVRTGKILD